jgi:hypothetical protein
MKTKVKTIYQCDYCNKTYLNKYFAAKHESLCVKNPENKRPCYGCIDLTKKNAEIYSGIDDWFNGEPIYFTKRFLFCKKHEKFLYTPQNAIKGNCNHIDENGDDFKNYAMPLDCEFKEYKYF